MELTGAQVLAECLLEQGVDTVFGYPGGAVLNIYDALYEYRDRIRHILTCHEQGAAHAADGYARSTGKTGVVIATSGPGATNLVTGIATAYLDSTPLVAITGNVATGLLGKDSFQEVDITGITSPVTKHNFIVKEVDALAQTVRDAFRIAREGRPGPVLIDVPKDVTAAKTEFTRREPVRMAAPAVNKPALDRAAKAIARSERPFVLAGGGVRLAGAEAELLEFAELLDAPVATTLMALGCFPASHRLFTGMIGMHGTRLSGMAASRCDLLIAVGTRFSDRVTCNEKLFAKNAKVLHIDIDPAEINKNVPAEYCVAGDARQVLRGLCAKLSAARRENWWKQLGEYRAPLPEQRGEVTPRNVIETLSRLTDGKAVICTDVGQHQMWAAQYYGFEQPRRFISSGGLGTMGFGLGAAIGAQAGSPDARVINVTGDGSFYMNLNELATCAKYGLPVMELLMNNGVLGMVRQWQKLFYGSRFSNTTLERDTDFRKLAEAFGVRGFTIAKSEDVEPVLKEALACKGPTLVDCRIDLDENVLPMVPAGGSVEEPLLEMERP